jgi:hypothetical protein
MMDFCRIYCLKQLIAKHIFTFIGENKHSNMLKDFTDKNI